MYTTCTCMYIKYVLLCMCALRIYACISIDEGATRTDLLSSLDNEDPVARALFKMIDEKVHHTFILTLCTQVHTIVNL